MLQTPFEAERLFAGDYAGKKARLCLATTTGGSLGLSSNTAAWDAVERSGNGYARCEWTIPAGTFNGTMARFEAGPQSCQFTASGAALTWNAAYLVIGTIGIGGAVTWYTISLFTDGFTVTA